MTPEKDSMIYEDKAKQSCTGDDQDMKSAEKN
jgi:hypothetical protein